MRKKRKKTLELVHRVEVHSGWPDSGTPGMRKRDVVVVDATCVLPGTSSPKSTKSPRGSFRMRCGAVCGALRNRGRVVRRGDENTHPFRVSDLFSLFF